MKFKFYIIKPVSWTPKYRQLNKTVTLDASDLVEARATIYSMYPNWQVSMFWPVY